MKNRVQLWILVTFGLVALSFGISSQPAKVEAQNNSHDPTWWSKYEFIRDNGGDAAPVSTTSTTVAATWMYRTNADRRARPLSRLIRTNPRRWPPAPMKFFACPCVDTIRRTAAAVGAAWICLCRRQRAPTELILDPIRRWLSIRKAMSFTDT